MDRWEEAGQFFRPIASPTCVTCCNEAKRSKRFNILLAFDDEDGFLTACVEDSKHLWVIVRQIECTLAPRNPTALAIWPLLAEAFSRRADYAIVRFSPFVRVGVCFVRARRSTL